MTISKKKITTRISRRLSTVSSRISLLIITTTIPLFFLSGILSWYNYSYNKIKSFENTNSYAEDGLKLITQNIKEINDTAHFFADETPSSQQLKNYFNLLEKISNNNYCDIILLDKNNTVIFHEKNQNKRICIEKIYPKYPKIIQNVNGIYISTTYNTKDKNKILIRKYITNFINNNNSYYIISSEFIDNSYAFHDLNKKIPQQILNSLKSDIIHQQTGDTITYETTNLSLNIISSGFFLLTVHKWTDNENKSQHRLLINFGIITTAIAIELMLIFVFSREFLVEPLEQLTLSVRDWLRGGSFSPHTNKAIPLEVRQLERAFLRATRHLNLRENELQKAIQQQDHLIHEIHHRVKNNLQIIVSLLNLHANRVTSPEAKKEFQLVRERVKAISTLHHHLYENADINCLYAQKFIPEISQNILYSGKESHNNIKLNLNIDDILISPSQAVPITLIITETISNSIRYAFPDNQFGEICIALKRNENVDNAVTLTLSDNGVGISPDPQTSSKKNGIGQKLIHGFARQLHAKFSIEHSNGTTYRVSFTLEPLDPPRRPQSNSV